MYSILMYCNRKKHALVINGCMYGPFHSPPIIWHDAPFLCSLSLYSSLTLNLKKIMVNRLLNFKEYEIKREVNMASLHNPYL